MQAIDANGENSLRDQFTPWLTLRDKGNGNGLVELSCSAESVVGSVVQLLQACQVVENCKQCSYLIDRFACERSEPAIVVGPRECTCLVGILDAVESG